MIPTEASVRKYIRTIRSPEKPKGGLVPMGVRRATIRMLPRVRMGPKENRGLPFT
jgi:hypothetical protein